MNKFRDIVGNKSKKLQIHSIAKERKRCYRLVYYHKDLRLLLPQLSFMMPEKERRRVLAVKILKELEPNGVPWYKNADHEQRLIRLCDEWNVQ